MKEYREASMSPAISAWLSARGHEVYTEVPYFSSFIDFVGVTWETNAITIVEAKVCLSKHVLHQCYLGQNITGEVYAAVLTHPRDLRNAEKHGVGVLQIVDGVVKVLLSAKDPMSNGRSPLCYERTLEHCRNMQPGGTGGMPTILGVGPAQRVYTAVQEYRKASPRAKWKEMFEAIPNHYSTPKSMAGGMRMVEVVREYRARRAREVAA